MPERLRTIRLTPYRPNQGSRFSLTTWDTGQRSNGRPLLQYRLCMDGKPLFQGSDYSPSPLTCIDSDESLFELLVFLTLRPGDTDPEYFENYTPDQMAFCDAHAEALQMEAIHRFGDH